MKYTCQMRPPVGRFTVGKEYECEHQGSVISIVDNEGVKVFMEAWLFEMSFRKYSS